MQIDTYIDPFMLNISLEDRIRNGTIIKQTKVEVIKKIRKWKNEVSDERVENY